MVDHQNFQGVIQPKGFPGLPQGWVSEWETIPGSCQRDEVPLNLFAVLHHVEKWGSPRALLVVHGLGEHGGRYLHLPHYLGSVVEAVYCLDLRGHGRSEGQRGHVERFDLFAEDVAIAIRHLDEKLKRRFGRSEIHILGHSMGGLIVLRAMHAHPDLPVRTVTVSAPLLGIKVAVPVAKRAAASVLSLVWGSLHMDSEVNPQHLSHDPHVAEAYVADRLVHKKVTPRFFSELQGAIAQTVREGVSGKSEMSYPLQVLVPLQDQIVDSEVAVHYFKQLKHWDKQLKTYPDFFHEPFNENGKEKAFEDLKSWIVTHPA